MSGYGFQLDKVSEKISGLEYLQPRPAQSLDFKSTLRGGVEPIRSENGPETMGKADEQESQSNKTRFQ
jgi:hypothetical protein